jgi:hypothetical protein
MQITRREFLRAYATQVETVANDPLPRTNVWLVLLRGGGQHPGHQQDESQSQRKEFRLNQREHDAMPTLDYHNCKRLITAAPPPRRQHTPAGAVSTKPSLDLEVQCPLVRPRSEQNRSLGGARQLELAGHKARDL